MTLRSRSLTVVSLAALACGAALLAVPGTGSAAPSAVAAAEAPTVVTSAWSGRATAVTATCPQGTQLVGGGYDSRPVHLGSGVNADAVNTNAPSASTPNSWTVKMDDGTAQAYAMCVKSSARPPTVVTSAWSASKTAVTATCPQGTSLAGGGYDSQPAHTGNGAIADAVNTNAPSPSNGWTVKMDIGKVQAYAMCTS